MSNADKFEEFWERDVGVPTPGSEEAAKQTAAGAWIHSGKPYGEFHEWWKENARLPEPGEEGAKAFCLWVWNENAPSGIRARIAPSG